MGGSKRLMEQMDEDLAWARTFLIKVGTLSVCEGHGDVFDGDGDIQRAYRILNAQVTDGSLNGIGDRTRRDLTDLLKRAYEDYGGPDQCPTCDRYMSD